MAFWFIFVHPFRGQIEMADTEYVMGKIRENFVSSHVSSVFARTCLEQLWHLRKKDKPPFNFARAGRWWNNREEIDIVAVSHHTSDILFCECKYTTSPVDDDVFHRLVSKT